MLRISGAILLELDYVRFFPQVFVMHVNSYGDDSAAFPTDSGDPGALSC